MKLSKAIEIVKEMRDGRKKAAAYARKESRRNDFLDKKSPHHYLIMAEQYDEEAEALTALLESAKDKK